MTTRTVQVGTYTNVTEKLSITTCPECGIVHGIPKDLEDACYKAGGSYYCPNGHYIGWCESEADRLRKRLNQAEKDRDYWQSEERRERERAEQLKREKAAVKGQLTKTKKRVGKGVCPCCNRHFTNVDRHMQTQHPEFASVPSQTTDRREP